MWHRSYPKWAILYSHTSNEIDGIVVGLPLGLDGQETDQTKWLRGFIDDLKKAVSLPFYFENEALSSVRAESELESRGKKYQKEDIDSLAACFILEDFLNNNLEI